MTGSIAYDWVVLSVLTVAEYFVYQNRFILNVNWVVPFIVSLCCFQLANFIVQRDQSGAHYLITSTKIGNS